MSTAPACDYISINTTVTVKCPDCGALDCETATGMAEQVRGEHVERVRLERLVLDKARLWSAAIVHGAYAQIQADNELRDALDALEEFESR